MDLTVGAIIEGKVKSITNFGAFIALPENRIGMVHISEVANTFVNDIRQHLTEGQDVRVTIIGVDPNGRINLSIKRLETAGQQSRNSEPKGNRAGTQNRTRSASPAQTPAPPAAPKSADQLFEERLKRFMNESDSKISSIRQYTDHRTRSRRR